MPIEQSRDPKRFSAFELSGWETNIRGYDSAFGAVARQTVGAMLDAARVSRGMRVLDVCCGPGMLAAGVLERGAEAIGLDFSLEAVELASKLVPTGRFERGDAQALPYAAETSMPCSADTASCTCQNPRRHCAKYCACCALVAEQRSAFGIKLALVLPWSMRQFVPEAAWTLHCRTVPIFSSSDHLSECWRR